MTDVVTRTELQKLIDLGEVTVVDALPAAYYDRVHIPGAINLVAEEVSEKAAELLPDTSASIVTYCSNSACSNSTAVARRLEALGYTNVRKYRDGIEDWSRAGLEVVSSLTTPR
jgi:rhodanese-related sulfurtransferase